METSIGELLLSGLNLMLIGMSIVFLFLALLVWVINMTARLIAHYSPEIVHGYPATQPQTSLEKTEGDDLELIAVITSAIHQHQNQLI